MKVSTEPAYRITRVSPICPAHNNSQRNPHIHYTPNKSDDTHKRDHPSNFGNHVDYLA